MILVYKTTYRALLQSRNGIETESVSSVQNRYRNQNRNGSCKVYKLPYVKSIHHIH